MPIHRGQWHGKKHYFGLHYDLHANKSDTELGVRATPRYLIPLLARLGADFVQTDCKGHPDWLAACQFRSRHPPVWMWSCAARAPGRSST